MYLVNKDLPCSDEVTSGYNSLPCRGPLLKFFQAAKREAKSFTESTGSWLPSTEKKCAEVAHFSGGGKGIFFFPSLCKITEESKIPNFSFKSAHFFTSLNSGILVC